MGTTTVTNSVTLHPTGYTGLTGMTINSSYPITNGYYDSSHTSYTRFDVTQSTTGYVYFLFDTSEIPSNATITAITGQFKARVSNTTRVTNTVAQLYANTTAKGSNVTFASTSASVRSLTPGSASSWTAENIANLRLRIGGTASSSTSSRRIDFYGANVTITYSYTITTYDITSSITGSGSIYPSGTTTVQQGDSYMLTISATNPTVTDNNINVTSQLTMLTSGSEVLIPESNTSSGFTVTDIDNAYNNANNTTYAHFGLSGSSTGTVYLDLSDLITMPSGSNILSVTAAVTLQYNRNNSTSGFTSSCQMYAGNTAKGSATSWVSSGSSDVSKTTFNLNVGSSWTETEINNARFYLTATNSARSTQRYVYIYGVSFNVTYEVGGDIYVYTINNISADHTIVVTTSTPSGPKLYVKINGTWKEVLTAYKKINGSWVEQSNISTLFNTTDNFKQE